MLTCSCCPPGARRHPLGRRGLLAAAGLACTGLAGLARADERPGGPPRSSLTPEEALAKLLDGNKRFLAEEQPPPRPEGERRRQLTAGQAPFAAILACADSRVAPELLFTTGLGEIFAVRNAGNVATTAVVGSLEYAVAALGVPVVMVLGHERCGAISAAVQVVTNGVMLPGLLGDLVEPMLPAATMAVRSGGNVVDTAVRANVRYATRALERSLLIGPAIAAGKTKVVGAHYDLDEGKVTLLD